MRASVAAGKAGAHRQRLHARNDVVSHGPPRRTGSIGLRLLVPVIAATVALVSGGTLIVASSIEAARDAYRSRVLADTAAAIVRLVDTLETEVAETNALRERGGTVADLLLNTQRLRTERQLAVYLQASRVVQDLEPELRRTIGHVTVALDGMAAARTAALRPGAPVSGLGDAFAQVAQHLLGLIAALAEQVNDPVLGNKARGVATASEIKHLAAEQRDLLWVAFLRRQIDPAGLVMLAEKRGDQASRTDEFTHIADDATRRRYTTLLVGQDLDAANGIRDAVLTSSGALTALAVDADAWYVAQSGVMRRLRTLELELTESMASTAAANQAAAQTRAIVIGLVVSGVVLGTLTGGGLLAVRTTRRLRRLRQAALTIARGELPVAVAQVAGADDAESVRGAMSASHRRVGAMSDPGTDEVAKVSAALGVVHRQALRLAAEQALLRMEVSALFVALSRRGQSLVHRQLQLIDDFERVEADPDNLARLFALDHLAARMRRNEENLLVLAGGEPGRRFEMPVVLTDVIRAASSEIEDYARVDPPTVEDVWVAAHAVGDVIHLLAELLDNAAAFSPPSSRVQVVVHRDGAEVTISVVDSGIGMSPAQLVEGNRRLTRPSALTSALVGTMGLLVVSRLAARRGIWVQLRRAPGGGTAADVHLPAAVLAPAPPKVRPSLTAVPARPPVAATSASAGATQAVTQVMVGVGVALATAEPDDAAQDGPSDRPSGGGAVATAVATAVEWTTSGLPLRRPGTHAVALDDPSQGPADRFLDPDVVRARLSSLAGGIAAARRHESSPGISHTE